MESSLDSLHRMQNFHFLPLQVRVEKAWANAAALGRKLEGDPRVTAVVWHEKVALVTFAVVGGFRGADAAVAAFRLITLSTT